MYPYDQNNQQMYQQYANAWNQGTYSQLPEQETRQNYQQFVQNAPPQMVEQVHQQYYQQMPQQQRGNLMQGLVGALTGQGFNPQQSGAQNINNPQNMSPQDAARLTSYAQQQNPDILHQIFSPSGPLGSTGAKLAVAGIAALAAQHFLGQNSSGNHGGIL